MIEMPADIAVEQRNQGYYVAGTAISLDSVAWAVKRGETADEILGVCRNEKTDGDLLRPEILLGAT
jgi:hypothetical protein